MLAEKEVGTKSLTCQIMIVNKVINFLIFFPNILLKIYSGVRTLRTECDSAKSTN